MGFKRLVKRIRYRKQLKQGFGLLEDLGSKQEFTVVGSREFLNIKENADGTISPVNPSESSKYNT